MIDGRTINRLTGNLFSSASQLIIDAVYAHYNVDPNKARFFVSNNMALPARSFLDIGGYNGVRFQKNPNVDQNGPVKYLQTESQNCKRNLHDVRIASSPVPKRMRREWRSLTKSKDPNLL